MEQNLAENHQANLVLDKEEMKVQIYSTFIWIML